MTSTNPTGEALPMLKACPFCGEVPTHRTSSGLTECTNADCPIEVKAFSVEDWNARVAIAALEPELLLRELHNLAVCLHRKHYSDVAQWRPLDDARGILSQIDNMTAGMSETIELLKAEIRSCPKCQPAEHLKGDAKAMWDALPLGREFIDEEALNRWREGTGNGHDLVANQNTVWRLVATIDHYRAFIRSQSQVIEGLRETLADSRKMLSCAEREIERLRNQGGLKPMKTDGIYETLAKIDAALTRSDSVRSEANG